MLKNQVSHEVFTSGKQHPFTAMVGDMVNGGGELRKMALHVRNMAKGLKVTPSLFDASLFEKLKSDGSEAAMKDMIRAMLKKETLKPVVHSVRPPPNRELYGRIDNGKKVLDVGSGDGKRLVRFEADLDLRTIDKEVVKTQLTCVHVQGTFGRDCVMRKREIVTSFCSMSQNKKPFDWVDGLHIVPNLVELVKSGLSVFCGEGFYETSISKNGEKITYNDYDHGLKGQSFGHYIGLNTYEERSGVVLLKRSESRAQSFGMVGMRILTQGVMDSMDKEVPTVKYDGELANLKIVCGQAALTFRDGERHVGVSDLPDMCLDLELLGDRVILIAVNKFNGFKPYHSIECLDLFTKRVKIRLKKNGPLIEPPRVLLEEEKRYAEGLVFRVGGKDLLISYEHSLDLIECDLAPLFKDTGLIPVMETSWREGVNEYRVVEQEGHARLHWKKKRKKKIPDDVETVRRILARPCLSRMKNNVHTRAYEAKT